jgi:hypothetical protein
MAFNKDFIREKLFPLGVALIFMGILVFFGATPGRTAANPVGGPRGRRSHTDRDRALVLPGIDYYLNR